MAGDAPPGYLSNAELAVLIANFVDANRSFLTSLSAWANGAADGGPNNDGRYPLVDSAGETQLIPCPARLRADSSGYGADVLDWATSVQAAIGDFKAAQDSAYDAENASLAAASSALSALISQALNFPADFVEGSRYFTGGNGQISSPVVAANNPVQGTFNGGFYQSVKNPESCYSIGPIGYVAGIPGTTIRISARFRALTDVSNGATGTNTGVGILPLKSDFSLVQFVDGAGAGAVKVADGWKTVTFDFVVPATTDPKYGAYYRPTFFMNVVGSANPLTPSTSKQGDQQFELAWLKVTVTPPSVAGAGSGGVSAPTLSQVKAAGSTTFVTPAGATYLRIRLKAAGGGGAGGGAGATAGGDGGASVFGGYQVSGGKGGASSASNYGRGGAGGTSTGAAPAIVVDGDAGENAENGYNYRRGASGGGAKSGGGGGFDPGQSAASGSGCGGAGGGVDNTTSPGGGGGEGGEIEFVITNPAAQYALTIGAGGAGGTTTDAAARAGGNGGDGFAMIEAR